MKIITLAIVALLLGVIVAGPAAATGQTHSPIETPGVTSTPTPTPFISLIETPAPTAITLTSFTARSK